jgi:hypothetical protein
LACSGLAPNATEVEWTALAGGNDRLQRGMARLHSIFKDAPVLGSLINPRAFAGDMIEAEFHELAPLLEKALVHETRDDATLEMVVIARGIAKAAELLAGHYTLVATNVPYLGRGNQGEILQKYCEHVYPASKADLATCFIERCLSFCNADGSTALVTPQNWLFLKDYLDIRKRLLTDTSWAFSLRLGSGAFETISGEVVKASLIVLRKNAPERNSYFCSIDVSSVSLIADKDRAIRDNQMISMLQRDQFDNPNHVVTSEPLKRGLLLQKFATAYEGAKTVDIERFRHFYWEFASINKAAWWFHNSSPSGDGLYSGCHYVSANRSVGSLFEKNIDSYEQCGHKVVAWLCGQPCWGKIGVSVAWMSDLPASLYIGTVFDNSAAVILPASVDYLLPIYCFITSGEYTREIRKINQKVQVAAGTLDQVPFDLAHWQKVASEKYPNGLPKPHSDDPTQWLFNGYPRSSDQPLHVAVARLLGYRWPRQTGSNFPDCPALEPDGLESFADEDGIVCLPPLNREQSAAARLRQLLATAVGTFDERALIAAAGLKGSKSKTLEDWLRDDFFEQHAKLFHDRPFIWHIWDGRQDGFHALVNYHKLDYQMLQKMTYSYLGDWIQQQEQDVKADKPGAAARLGAARILQTKLAAILEGEAPLDIFARWKPIKDQAQGWHPDINDGIRQNIRPFLLAGDVGKRGAGLFRTIPLDLKDKDRGIEPTRSKTDYPWFRCEDEPGTNPEGGKEPVGNRWNNVHLTLSQKQKAKL